MGLLQMLLVFFVVSSVDMTCCLFCLVTAWSYLYFAYWIVFNRWTRVHIHNRNIDVVLDLGFARLGIIFLKRWASCCRFVVCIFFSGRCFCISYCFQVLYCSPCVGVPVLLRVVIGRQCSRFPVDVTYKKRAMWFVCLFPCDPGDEGVWAKWLSWWIMWFCWSLVVSWRWVLVVRSFLGW